MENELFGLFTQNVRGLGKAKKRRILFNKLKSTGCKVFLLQETHSVVELEKVYRSEWGKTYSMFFFHGVSNSRGVAVIVKSESYINCEPVFTDKDGPIIIIQLFIVDIIYYIVNIYAPNTVIERKNFYCSLLNIISELNLSNNIIIGRDFNTPLECIDKKGSCRLDIDVIDTIEHLGNVLQLNDIWRLLYPDIEQFTW